MKLLIVVDMQNDFVTGALANDMAKDVLPRIESLVKNYKGIVMYTRDTHDEYYMDTMEGKKLPVVHCVEYTQGWELCEKLNELRLERSARVFDKKTFGSVDLCSYIRDTGIADEVEAIEICGVCTDICVISNAITLKAFVPNADIKVLKNYCAGTTKENHEQALAAMKQCHIEISDYVESFYG